MNVQHERDYLHIPVNNEMLEEAKQRCQARHDIHGDYQTTKPNSRIQGFIAEAAIKYCYPSLNYHNGTQHDLETDDKQVTFDIKSGKVSSPPRVYFNIHLLAYQTIHSKHLVFCSVLDNFKVVIAKGHISTTEFKSLQFTIAEGERIGSLINDRPRFAIKGNQLHTMNTLADLFEG